MSKSVNIRSLYDPHLCHNTNLQRVTQARAFLLVEQARISQGFDKWLKGLYIIPVSGVEIWAGDNRQAELIEESRVILASGTAAAHRNMDDLPELAGQARVVFYGVVVAGVAGLLGLRRICRYARKHNKGASINA